MSAIAEAAVSRATLLRRDELVAALLEIVRVGRVIQDEQGRRVYSVDAFGAYVALPLAVILPSSVREVSQVLRYCYSQPRDVLELRIYRDQNVLAQQSI